MPDYEPLRYPENVLSHRYPMRIAIPHTRKQLAARKAPPDPNVWVPEKRDVARRLGEVCALEYSYPNSHFIPEDPFDVMICGTAGDLCEVETLMAIEDEFDVAITEDSEPNKLIETMTMRDMVRWLMEEIAAVEAGEKPRPQRAGCAGCLGALLVWVRGLW